MGLILRAALPSDLPYVAALDVAVSPDFPVVSIPWAKASDVEPVFLDRYQYFYKHPEYRLIVAVSESDEIVGFLLWRKPSKDEGKMAEWEPPLPVGTNLAFFQYFLAEIERDNLTYHLEQLYELKGLGVSTTQQRMGIGSLLIKKFLEEVDGDQVSSYVKASVMGKPLYEKFGWKTIGVFRCDLKEFGREEEYVDFHMKREKVDVRV